MDQSVKAVQAGSETDAVPHTLPDIIYGIPHQLDPCHRSHKNVWQSLAEMIQWEGKARAKRGSLSPSPRNPRAEDERRVNRKLTISRSDPSEGLMMILMM